MKDGINSPDREINEIRNYIVDNLLKFQSSDQSSDQSSFGSEQNRDAFPCFVPSPERIVESQETMIRTLMGMLDKQRQQIGSLHNEIDILKSKNEQNQILSIENEKLVVINESQNCLLRKQQKKIEKQNEEFIRLDEQYKSKLKEREASIEMLKQEVEKKQYIIKQVQKERSECEEQSALKYSELFAEYVALREKMIEEKAVVSKVLKPPKPKIKKSVVHTTESQDDRSWPEDFIPKEIRESGSQPLTYLADIQKEILKKQAPNLPTEESSMENKTTRQSTVYSILN